MINKINNINYEKQISVIILDEKVDVKILRNKSDKKLLINKRKNKLKNNLYKKEVKINEGQKIETTVEPSGTLYKLNNKNILIKGLKKVEDELQDMDFKEAIIYDKRTFFKMYWSFLLDSQIILSTFFTENYLNLFIIKLSFLIFTIEISFFLNAFFYTDEYISDAYHNDGVLYFITSLPQTFYSFIATFIATNLLSMLSNSKNELQNIINKILYNKY